MKLKKKKFVCVCVGLQKMDALKKAYAAARVVQSGRKALRFQHNPLGFKKIKGREMRWESLCGGACMYVSHFFWFCPLLKCPNGQILRSLSVFIFCIQTHFFLDMENENWVQICKPNQNFVVGLTKNWKWIQKTPLFSSNQTGP